MALSLKARSNLLLVPLLTADLLIEYAILFQPDTLSGVSLSAYQLGASSILGAAIAICLSGLLSADMKARIVFWRWDNPLPGSYAFTVHALEESRVDLIVLRHRYSELFSAEPKAQNALWYKLYKKHQKQPGIEDTHLRFLFTRDAACVTLVIAVAVIAVAVRLSTGAPLFVTAVLLLVVQYFLFAISARQYGIRLVRTVLAEESVAERPGNGNAH